MSVLVTRPAPDGVELCKKLMQQDIKAYHHALIDIEAGQDFYRLPKQIKQVDIIIAISKNAVLWANESLKQAQQPWPKTVSYFAIGDKTAHYLEKKTQKSVSYANPSDSEHLLKIKDLQKIRKKSILILRGNGGRELIFQTLISRGAKVTYSEIYHRNPIKISEDTFIQWQDVDISSIVVTSKEQLLFLVNQSPSNMQAWLKNCRLYVPSQRIEQEAKKLGFMHLNNTGSAANSVLLDSITKTQNSG